MVSVRVFVVALAESLPLLYVRRPVVDEDGFDKKEKRENVQKISVGPTITLVLFKKF